MRLWTYSVAVFILWSAAWAENAPDILILTNINVVDTRFGSVQTNHTVVIKEGRIVAVARHGLIEENRHTQIMNRRHVGRADHLPHVCRQWRHWHPRHGWRSQPAEAAP
jgi:hypothetical protein